MEPVTKSDAEYLWRSWTTSQMTAKAGPDPRTPSASKSSPILLATVVLPVLATPGSRTSYPNLSMGSRPAILARVDDRRILRELLFYLLTTNETVEDQ